MTAQKGRDLLLKLDTGSGFITVAGLRTRRLAFNSQAVDATDSQSAGRWRELLGAAGIRRATISGDGIFKDHASDEMVRGVFFDTEIADWQVVIPDFGTVEGRFQVVSLEYAGNHDGELRFRLQLESAGQLGFAAAA